MVERGSVRVLNGGPVIPPETLAVLKKPFVRGSSVGGGGGLGLAIVDDVMKQFGGSLGLLSPVPGRDSGFEVRLLFPEPEQTVTPMQQPQPPSRVGERSYEEGTAVGAHYQDAGNRAAITN